MIRQLLLRLAQNPRATFEAAEFADRQEDLAHFLSTGVLGRVEPKRGLFTLVRDGRHLQGEADGTGFVELFDPDDSDFDELRIAEDDICQYAVELGRLGWRLARHFGVRGSHELVGERVIVLGEATPRIGMVVMLAASESVIRAEAGRLAHVMPSHLKQHVLVFPSWVGPRSFQAELERDGTVVTCVMDDALALSPTLDIAVRRLAPASDVVGFDAELGVQWVEGFHWVKVGGSEYQFSHQQAVAFEVLFRARQAGANEVHQETILNRIVTERDLRAVFREHPAWQSLIESSPGRKGMYRLALPKVSG